MLSQNLPTFAQFVSQILPTFVRILSQICPNRETKESIAPMKKGPLEALFWENRFFGLGEDWKLREDDVTQETVQVRLFFSDNQNVRT